MTDEPRGRAGGLTESLLEELFALPGAEEFISLLVKRPELRTEAVKSQLRELSTAPGYGAGFASLLELIEGADQDVEAAWRKYEQRRRAAEEISAALIDTDAELTEAMERRDFQEALSITEWAIPKAASAGLGLLVSTLLERRGLAYFQRSSGDRANDIEYAIEALEAALDLAVDAEHAAGLLMHLAILHSERLRGDRGDNTEATVDLLHRALSTLDGSEAVDLRSMIETNLAMALIRRVRGDRNDNLREAVAACRRALQERSLRKDAVDWAYTQLNLGEALASLAAEGDADASDRAARAYEEVTSVAGEIPATWLVGLAHQGLGRIWLRGAQISLDETVDAVESGDEPPDQDDPRALAAARSQLEHACDLLRGGPEPIRYGRALGDLSEAQARQHDTASAIETCSAALAILRPTSEPRACFDVAARLGDLLAQQGEWGRSSAAFKDAIASADLTFDAQLDFSLRREEQLRAGTIYRWAAYVVARGGEPVEAARILENGRAREIRRRIHTRGDILTRAQLPQELSNTYALAVDALHTSPLGAAGASSARALAEVIEAIRRIPGYEDFQRSTGVGDIAAALEDDWPVVYVNPTPYGTLLLTATGTQESLSVSPEFLNPVTSTDIIMRLLVGRAADLQDPSSIDETTSYILGISGEGEGDGALKLDLDELLPWLGEVVARPIHAVLDALHARGCTLISCGPIALAPLHAATWEEEGESRCLLDAHPVRFAPTAALIGASLESGARNDRSTAHLVAVADPTCDLPATEPEVEEISKLFGHGQIQCAFRDAATREFLSRHAAHGTYIHLACHARTGVLADSDAYVVLADGPLYAEELAALGPFSARLVVVSACQSGLSNLSDLPDESVSLGSAMLAAGGACAVGSLWPVDDFATALLMVRMYEEHLARHHRPPEALRRAQLWLRALTADEEARFLDSHPKLRLEFSRRATARDLPGKRHAAAGGGAQVALYSHPEYWSAFVAVGA